MAPAFARCNVRRSSCNPCWGQANRWTSLGKGYRVGSKIQIMEVDMGQTSKMEIQEESILVAVCASVSGVYLTLKCAHIEIRVQVKKNQWTLQTVVVTMKPSILRDQSTWPVPIIQVDVVLYGGNTFPVGGRNKLLQSWHYPVIMVVFHKRQTNRSGMISLSVENGDIHHQDIHLRMMFR